MVTENQDDKKVNSTISISKELKDKIKSFGGMGDSFDTVLTKIINAYEIKMVDGE